MESTSLSLYVAGAIFRGTEKNWGQAVGFTSVNEEKRRKASLRVGGRVICKLESTQVFVPVNVILVIRGICCDHLA